MLDGAAELSQALLLFPLSWPPLREQLSGSGLNLAVEVVDTIYEMFTIFHWLSELLQLIFNITSSQKEKDQLSAYARSGVGCVTLTSFICEIVFSHFSF